VSIRNLNKNQSLTKAITYTLVFDVDTEIRDATIAAPVFDDSQIFGPGEMSAELTVLLDSTDFALAPTTDTLVVPRQANRPKTRPFGSLRGTTDRRCCGQLSVATEILCSR
jgi:hypothetical protein